MIPNRTEVEIMHCKHCGENLVEEEKFCRSCGATIDENTEKNCTEKKKSERQTSYDAVEDLKKKLESIERRKKPSTIKNEALKKVFDLVKNEAEEAGISFDIKYKNKKLQDKKQTIDDFPLPDSAEELLNLSKYIQKQILSKRKNDNDLKETWQEKLKEAYRYAKKEFCDTEQFFEIETCYKKVRRKARHEAMRPIAIFPAFIIIAAFGVAIVEGLPLLMFATAFVACFETYFIFYVYDLLEDWLAYQKSQNAKRSKGLRVSRLVAWLLLAPVFATLITSIFYFSTTVIIIVAAVFVVLLLFLVMTSDD